MTNMSFKVTFSFTVLLLFTLICILLHTYFILTAFLSGALLIYSCKQRQDYVQIDQTESRPSHGFLLSHVTDKIFSNKKVNTRNTQNQNSVVTLLCPTNNENVLNSCVSFENRAIMWGNSSFSSPKKTSKMKLNSTMPVRMSSPMSTRQRQSTNQRLNNSVISAAGPLLSSPFMPQIKRALGLEPNSQPRYSAPSPRRHSFGLSAPFTMSPASPGALPHVRLNKSHRMSLTEKNSSMLNRSSTVKIAPPLQGKVASPSLYQLRNDSIILEDRSTPDTYAVISALKERRKRSINTHEESTEHPVPQAKRRRQESQQSNASTSSMPSLPDNLPDLSNADFSLRLETPGIKRPSSNYQSPTDPVSRPSQDEYVEWEQERNAKRARGGDARNNSILSSLSSSRRYCSPQTGKRKAENSLNEKENGGYQDRYQTKAQRKEPPKLTHLDITMTTESVTPVRKPADVVSVVQTAKIMTDLLQTDDDVTSETESKEQSTSQKVTSKGPVLRNMPSMKKTASVYSGFNSSASFKKTQYANVVATIDDYDSDREAEQKRVKQMLNDLDDSFTEKKAKSLVTDSKKTEISSLTTTTTSVSTAVSIATSSSSTATTTTSVLSALQNLNKSPVQETGSHKPETSQAPPTFKPMFPPISTSVASTADTKPGVISFGSSVSTSTALLGQTLSSNTATSAPASSVLVSSSQSVAPSLLTGSNGSTATSSTGNFSFGTSLARAVTGASSVGGFNFSTNTTAKGLSGTAPTATSEGLSFGQKPATTALSGFGTGFGSAPPPAYISTATSVVGSTITANSSSGGFSFGSGVSAAPPPAYASTPAISSATTANPGGFSFGSGASTAPPPVYGSTPAVTSATTANPGGFSFGKSAVSTSAAFGSTPASAATPAGGFTFGVGLSSAPAVSQAAGTGVGGFSFNTSQANTTMPSSLGGFGFGTSAPAGTATTAPGGFSFSATTPATAGSTTGFAFSASTAATTAAPSLQFGVVKTTTPSGFSFGGAANTASGVGFGSGVNATVTTAPGFAFGGAQTTNAGAATTPFGAQTTSTPFSFNAGVTKATSAAVAPFSFNSGAMTTTATVSPFQTGTKAAPAAGGGFSFGQGASASVGSSGAFQFGAGSTGTAPAFGSANAQPAPAFGMANPTPAFGSITNQPPAFGSTNQTPAFGSSSSNQTPAFGTGMPTFGVSANQQQQSNTPAFGVSAISAPGFGKSHSMPAFGTSIDNSSGTFNFGNPAPNVNPFGQGQTTPAKQTGSAFGQVGNDITPKQQTGSMFAFGGPSNTNSSASKGFDFSAAGGSSSQNTGGFNFMAASTVPVFNFGSSAATPSAFGTPGATPGAAAFSVGTAEAPRLPRAISKARNRRTRR